MLFLMLHAKKKKVYPGDGYKVAVIDLGVKRNIIKSLLKRGCQVTVYPAETPAEEIIADAPDGIMLTNGPGDPKDCKVTIKEVKKLFDTDIPIFCNMPWTSAACTCKWRRYRKDEIRSQGCEPSCKKI